MINSALVWFRRDLRDSDHAALSEALRRARQVYCVFVFDREILDALPQRNDSRVEFIRESLVQLDRALRQRGGGLIVRHAFSTDEIPCLAEDLGVSAVFTNRDYEPQAKQRDAVVEASLSALGIAFETFKDQTIFEGPEVLTQAGRPFTVFTPYKNAWLKRLSDDDLLPHPTLAGQLVSVAQHSGVPTLDALGFSPSELRQTGISPGMSGAQQLLHEFRPRIAQYKEHRDIPAIDGGSRLSMHLRFGTLSIRQLVSMAQENGALNNAEGAACWLSELIWRDFYFMILDHFPHVADRAFKPAYEAIAWEQGDAADALFAAWCAGKTGYPLVDAAMHQLNHSGFMHNRLRMVSASFLSKDLGIDWRRGEAYFARQLNDFDLAANNGGWQWAASSGCDAQPYFRIFNPITQSERFDPEGRFIRQHLPQLSAVPERFIHAPWRMNASEQDACGVIIGKDFPAPIVDHSAARQRTLERYAIVRKSAAD
ncbi:MAG: deoxyribodipyrimidine photo-lyase [Betaproteobacteria bacterium]